MALPHCASDFDGKSEFFMFIGFKKGLFVAFLSKLTVILKLICWIVDLNYLRTSDNFIRWIEHFYPMDNVIQASYNAIFTLDKIYPADSELSAE